MPSLILDDLIDDFTKHFAKYTKLVVKNNNNTLPIELTFEGVPKPFLVHSSAIKRLKLSTTISNKSMLILKPPNYDTSVTITDSYTENFKLSDKYATIKVAGKHHPIIKLTYEFVEWLGDITKELKALHKNQKTRLTDLPEALYESIADHLRAKDVITLRRTAKVFNKTVQKPKKMLHKHDIRNYLSNSIVSDLDLDYHYLPNEAKVLFLAKEINPNYDKDQRLLKKHNHLIKPTILQSGASEGDIIFAGDTYEGKQTYGFYIKSKNSFDSDNEAAYYTRSKGLVKFAKKIYPTKNYDNALKLLNAMWEPYFGRPGHHMDYWDGPRQSDSSDTD